jgi:putative addiction module component (TIGR02574 family)
MFDDTQLESLPVSEKLRLVTTLWDQISRSGETISVSHIVLDDADRRIKEMMVDPSASLTEDEMWRRADELR